MSRFHVSLFLALVFVAAGRALAQLPATPVPPENPITPEKRVLGKMLFWDEQLSSDNTVACGTCHIPGAGGADPRTGPGVLHPGPDGSVGTPDDVAGSPGVIRQDNGGLYQPDPLFGLGVQNTPRHTPTNIASAYFDELFWDGSASGTFVNPDTGQVSIADGGALETQSLMPLVSDVEMAREGLTLSDVATKLESVQPLALASNLTLDINAALAVDPTYPELFENAFGDPAVTAERIAFALATYQRTLTPNQTPWDAFVAGNPSALTPNQIQGLAAFNGAQRCNQCHTAPLFSDGEFRNIGVRPWQEDPGRFDVTGNFADRGKFKVPTLRNVGLRTGFFHNGETDLAGVEDAVAFYNGGGGPFPVNKDPILVNPVPIVVPPPVVNDIADFLVNGLTDPRVLAEAPPFDRPRLHSESVLPNPAQFGFGVAGSGGLVPAMIAVVPPNLGNQDFKVAVSQALGGSVAVLAASHQAAPPGTVVGGVPVFVNVGALILFESMPLAGAGPGQGFTTFQAPLPDAPTLAGIDVIAQWFVVDGGATNGIASTRAAAIELF